MTAAFPPGLFCILLHLFYFLPLLQHDATSLLLCIAFSLLVKKLGCGVIPPWSLLLLPHAFGQIQAEMSCDFSTVAFSLPVGRRARYAAVSGQSLPVRERCTSFSVHRPHCGLIASSHIPFKMICSRQICASYSSTFTFYWYPSTDWFFSIINIVVYVSC